MKIRYKQRLLSMVWGLVFFALSVVLPVGCKMGPDYERPPTLAESAKGYNYADQEVKDANAVYQEIEPWWRHFGDPVITELVEEALKNNLDLKASAARVLESEALLAQARGQRLPEVSYGANRDRSKFYFNSPFGRMSFLSTTWGHQLSINYMTDLFGKLRRAEEATWRQFLASQADGQALMHAIIAQVVRTRTQIATQQKQLAIARANTASWQTTLEAVERRYNQGLVDSLDVRLARENLAATQVTEWVLLQTLIITQNALDVLLGRAPGTTALLFETLPEAPDSAPPPVGVPAYLLDRRPDLISAEMQLAAATAQVGVSVAQLFPDLTLSGNYGFRGSEFEDLFINETQVYGLVMQFLQPVFQGGRLLAQVDASQARVEQAAANYASAVLTAMREVEDALVQEKMLRQRLELFEERLKGAQASDKLAQDRYQQGLEGILMVLDTERRRRIAENELAATKGQLWSNRVDMILALGGDWGDITTKSSEKPTNETASPSSLKSKINADFSNGSKINY